MTIRANDPLSSAARAWRRLRSMRTAIILLIVLAAGAAVGSIVPQRPVDPRAVAAWISRNPEWAPLARRLGLFDVFGAWWFMAVYSLLLVSLAGCLVPRIRAYAKQIRRRPQPRRVLSGLDASFAIATPAGQAETLDAAERALRRRRFRVERHGDQVAAEKGHMREAGSLAFHVAFFVLLIGMGLGKLFGFSGQVAIVEGEAFTDTPVAFDSLRRGRLAGEHTGIQMRVEGFDVAFHPNGVPRSFESHVRVVEDGREGPRETIRVNHPITRHGVSFFQIGWGWAPEIRVTASDGTVLADGPVIFLADEEAGFVRGVVKAPSASPELGLEMWFYNDLDLTEELQPFNASPEARNPAIFFREYRGDLGLDRPQSVYTLDKTGLAEGELGAAAQGETAELSDGTTVAFTGLRQFTVFQVARDPGAPIVLAGAILLLAGLLPSLYVSRRRVWIRAVPAGDGARIEAAGVALQRRDALAGELEAIVREVRGDRKMVTGPTAGVGSSRP